MHTPTIRLSLALVVAGAGLAGCGPAIPPSGTVSGKVTAAGKPLNKGVIRFTPSAGEAGANWRSEIAPDGSFRVSEIPLGDYRVSVETKYLKGLKPMPGTVSAGKGEKGAGKAAAGEAVQVAAKYESPETSGLTHAVAEGPQEKSFDCP